MEFPKYAKQFSRFFIRATKSSKSTYQCEVLKIFPYLYRFLVKVFSSFEFSFFSKTADLTTQPPSHPSPPTPVEFPSFPSFSSLGSSNSAVVRLTEAVEFVELCFLFLCCKFFVLFLDFLFVF